MGGTLTNTWTATAQSHVFIGSPGLTAGQGFEKTDTSAAVAVSAYFTTLGLIVNGSIGSNARVVDLTTTAQAFAYTAAGSTPSPTTATITATTQNTSGIVYYEFLIGTVSQQNTTSNTYTYTPEIAFTSMPKQITVKVREGAADAAILATDTMAMIGLRPGTNAVSGFLTNEAATVAASSTGVVSSYTGTGGTFSVYDGITDKTGNTATVTYSVVSTPTGITASIAATGVYTLSAMTVDSTSVTFRAIYAGVTIDKIYSIAKSKEGAAGLNSALFSIDNSSPVFRKNLTGTILPAGITLTTTASNITSITAYQWQKNAIDISGATASSYTVPIADYASVATNTYKCTVTGTINAVAGSTLNDSVIIPRLDDGSSAPTVVMSNGDMTFAGPYSGYTGISFASGSCGITAYIGTQQLSYAASGLNTFSATTGTGVGITVAAGAGTGYIYTVPAPTAMSVDSAYVDITVTLRDANGTALASTQVVRITYALSRMGVIGVTGLNSALFSIDNSSPVFRKNLTGTILPAGITLTTTASNITSITAYQWQKNAIDISGATASSYTVPIADYASVATNTYKCTVTGTINAVAGSTLNDSVIIPRLDDGSSAPTVVMSNGDMTFAGPYSGYTGISFASGSCGITAYIGTQQLSYAASGLNTFSATTGTGVGITVAAGAGTGYIYTVPAPTAMSVDSAYVDITVTLRDANGTALASTQVVRITYALSRMGDKGTDSTVPGIAGPTALFAYCVINSDALPSAPSIGAATTPTAGAAVTSTSASPVWYLQPKAILASKDWMFQVSGTKTAAGVYAWQTLGYLSTFKVGKLDALSADLGAITAGSIKIGTSPVISTSAFTSGSGAVVNTDGSFGFGNTTTSIVGNGTGTITLTGNVVGNSNIADTAVNARTIATGAVTASKIDITNAASGGRIVINNNQFIIYDDNQNIRVKIGLL